MMKRHTLAVVIASVCAIGGPALADTVIPSNSWPAAWFKAPVTASEAGITQFQESPYLTERVQQGDLPPVTERLPNDPYIVQPSERVGDYGGTIRAFHRDRNQLKGLTNPLTMDPEVSGVLPNLASGWAYSEDARELILHLRKGLRWSDGAPFSAHDWVYEHEHGRLNKELNPVISPRWIGVSVTAPDSFTVVFRFKDPHPFYVQELAHSGSGRFLPSHFMKKYHPDFIGHEEATAQAAHAGYMNWMAYYNDIRSDNTADPSGKPTMDAFVLIRRSPTLWVYERNPYYPKIDPAGNQLPYADQLMAFVVMNPEVVTAKTSTGQVHFSAISLATPDIPLFKRGEKAGGSRTFVWNRLHGVDVVIQPNLTSEDLVLREIFNDRRFRFALSHAIDRDEINTIVYFDRATPRQTTVVPTSVFYEPEFASAGIVFDPEKSRKLLEEMGLHDRDGDGIRERPDGEPLSISLEWVDIETPKGITMELVTTYWRDIGVDLHLKQVDNNLQSTRARANLMQMTIWHADRTTDILFPTQPFWFVPMHRGWEECHWTPWSSWYISSGTQGEAPPPIIQALVDDWVEMTTSNDAARRIELGKSILRSQAENLWTIGTLGLAPQPVVVSNKLRNVPSRGYWGWDNRMNQPYHPETWFLENGGRP